MSGGALTEIGLPVALMIVMIGVGLSLTPKDFQAAMSKPSSIVIGLLLQLALIPALGFGVALLLGNGLLAAGLVLVAILPGGTTSNMLTYLAKGNLALSIMLTVSVSLITILTIPPLMNLALDMFVTGDQVTGKELHLDFVKTVIMIGAIVIVPTIIGMTIRHFKTEFADKFESAIGKFSAFVLIAIVVAIVNKEWDSLPGWIAESWHMILALNISAMLLAVGLPKLLGVSFKDSITTGIEAGVKNTTLGLTIALTLLESSELAIPAAVYGLMMYPGAFLMIFLGRKLFSDEAKV